MGIEATGKSFNPIRKRFRARGGRYMRNEWQIDFSGLPCRQPSVHIGWNESLYGPFLKSVNWKTKQAYAIR
ncbi:MAG: hypothetical protein WC505_07765 [Patescibacteria group bacterium]